jgi:protein-arginine kinase activator protein McsA
MEISLSNFVLAVVFGSCVCVLVLAAVSRFLHYRSEKRALRRRIVCRLCLHAFEDLSNAFLVDCPSCHARNERTQRPL